MSVRAADPESAETKAGGTRSQLTGWVTPEQEEIYAATLAFARSLGDDIVQRDRERRFSREDWDRCGSFPDSRVFRRRRSSAAAGRTS